MRRLTILFAGSLLVVACGTGSDDVGSPTDSEVSVEITSDVTPTEPDTTETPVTEPPSTEPAPTAPPATDPPATDPPATEAPEPELAPFKPIGDGPYAVGVQTITVTDTERERPLTVDVTFPLLDGVDGTVRYEMFEPSETLAGGEVLSLEEKFLAGEGQNLTPARLGTGDYSYDYVAGQVKTDLERAARTLGVEGYCRAVGDGLLVVSSRDTAP